MVAGDGGSFETHAVAVKRASMFSLSARLGEEQRTILLFGDLFSDRECLVH